MRCPNIWTLKTINDVLNGELGTTTPVKGKWVPKRGQITIESFKNRCKAAWMVFTGKADALTWPEDDGVV